MTKARDIADFKFENITDTGTEGTKIASGTTAQRGITAGQLRFNTTSGNFEFRDSIGVTDFLSPPQISSLDKYDVDTDAGGDITFTITGKNFKAGAVVSFVDNTGTSVNASSTTVVSPTEISAVIARSNFSNANEPYDVKIINGDALQVVLENQVNVDNDPVWQTGASLTTIYQDLSYNISFNATDSDGDAVTYSHISGTLPTGLTFASNGVLSGTAPQVGGATSFVFTIRATANGKTADREFTQVVDQNSSPVWQTASGTLGTLYDIQRSDASSQLTQPTAIDYQNETITYTVTTGSLPTNLTLNANGSWSGTPDAVGSNTTYTFTISADDGITSPTTREFTITILAPQVIAFTTADTTGTWTSPITGNIKVLAVGGCGAYGANGGHGGAGAVCYNQSYNVVQGQTYDYQVGKNGYFLSGSGVSNGANGLASKFGLSGNAEEIIALGGCGGAEGSQSDGSVQITGGANEGSYFSIYGVQAIGCTHRNTPLGTCQAGTGGTIYAGHIVNAQAMMQHYNWNNGASAGSNGDGGGTPQCGGSGVGGAGVQVTSLDSAFGAYTSDGYMACGKSYSGNGGSQPNPVGWNEYGSANWGQDKGNGVVLLRL